MGDVLGQGLVTASGPLWKAHRAIVQTTFHVEILERFVDVFAEEAAGYVARMRPLVGRDVEFTEEMHRATAASVLRTTLSSNTEDLDKEAMEVGRQTAGAETHREKNIFQHFSFLFTVTFISIKNKLTVSMCLNPAVFICTEQQLCRTRRNV